MMCPKCGADLPYNATSCHDCGALLRPGSNGSLSFDPNEWSEVELRQRSIARNNMMSIRTYKIITLFCTLFYIIVLFSLISKLKSNYFYDGGGHGLLMIGIALVLFVVGIMEIVAVHNMSAVNDHYDRAFRILIAGILLSVLKSFFDDTSLKEILSAASSAVSLFYLYHFCKGSKELCGSDAREIGDRWSLYWIWILVMTFIAQIAAFWLTGIVKSSRISMFDALIYAEIIIIISEALDLVISIFMINILGKTVDYLGETKRRNR